MPWAAGKRVLAAAFIFIPVFFLACPIPSAEADNWDWIMFRHNPERTGTCPFAGPLSSDLKWTYTVGAALLSSPAAVYDELNGYDELYMSSSDGNLYALSSGAFHWTYAAGENIESSPAVLMVREGGYAYDEVYFGSNDNNLYALKSSGMFDWSYVTGGDIVSSPLALDISAYDAIYFGSNDATLYALHSSGAFRWSYATGGDIRSSPAIGYDELGNIGYDSLYFGSNDNYLYALNSVSGEFRWSYATGGEIASAPAVLWLDDGGGGIRRGVFRLRRQHFLRPAVVRAVPLDVLRGHGHNLPCGRLRRQSQLP